MASILATSIRAPRAYLQCQLPLVIGQNSIDPAKLGSQLILDSLTSVRRQSILEAGSDTLDAQWSNQSGDYSPFNPQATMGRYFYPGAVDNKYWLFLGVSLNGAITVLPKGIYLSESVPQQSKDGQNVMSLSALDQSSMFRGDVYTQFPPRLYGNQQGSWFNPNYALKNPSSDLKTYVCDAVDWMQNANTPAAWGSDFVAVAVYVSADSNGSVPTSRTFTINYNTGTVTFTNPLPGGSVVSVDARPLGMAPELMLKHLFVDFGSFDPNFLKFDTSGIILPIMENARDRPMWDVATEITLATNPRGMQWMLYFDENGYLVFTEGALDGPPVKTLIDQKDILSVSPEYTSRDIANVIRASAVASNNQPLVSISYDVRSISTFGQKPTYDIPSQVLATSTGMDPGSLMTFMNGVTGSVLANRSFPSLNTEIEVLYDPTLQIGDPLQVIEKKTGLNTPFYINQINEEIAGPEIHQILRLTQLKMVQDFMFGLPYFAGQPTPSNQNTFQIQSGLISSVVINSTTVVNNGQAVLDSTSSPIQAQWNAANVLSFTITLARTSSAATGYVWRWIYIAEDSFQMAGNVPTVNTGAASNAIINYPSWDYTNNQDSPRARRLYWPLLRCSDWVTNDGVTAYDMTQTQTLISNWSGIGAASGSYIYGNLVLAATDYYGNRTGTFVGQQLWANGTPFATQAGMSSTYRFGVDWGSPITTPFYYGIKRKITPCYLCILVANTQGTVQFKRIPFQLVQ